MELADCNTRHEVGLWMESKGFRVGENRGFSTVNPVHIGYLDGSWTSWHYHETDEHGALVLGPRKLVNGYQTPQGNLAMDVNFDSKAPSPWQDEADALHWLYTKLHHRARLMNWPLMEMFYNGFGFLKVLGYDVNHPITGHNDHLHVAWYRDEL